jgi:hypothetical protein
VQAVFHVGAASPAAPLISFLELPIFQMRLSAE